MQNAGCGLVDEAGYGMCIARCRIWARACGYVRGAGCGSLRWDVKCGRGCGMQCAPASRSGLDARCWPLDHWRWLKLAPRANAGGPGALVVECQCSTNGSWKAGPLYFIRPAPHTRRAHRTVLTVALPRVAVRRRRTRDRAAPLLPHPHAQRFDAFATLLR